MARVIISSGHTTSSPGTIVGDLREVDLARKIAKMVTPYLRQNGIITLAVPYEMELPKRIDWINSTGYKAQQNDVVLEIHINEGGKSGVEAWYVNTENGASKQFATAITDSIKAKTGLKIQGVNDEKTHEYGGIGLLQQVGPVSALIECLYIDNPEDQKFLRSEPKLDDLAEAIAAGIAEFLGVEFTGRTHTKAAVSASSPAQKPAEQKPAGEQKPAEAKALESRPIEPKPTSEKPISNVVTQAKPVNSQNVDTYDDQEEQEDEDDDDYEDDMDTEDENTSDQDDDGMDEVTNDLPQPSPRPIAKPAFPTPSQKAAFGGNTVSNPRDNFPTFGGGSSAGGSAFGGGNSGGSFGTKNSGGSAFGGSQGGGTFGGSPAGAGKAPMSREERKDMISKYYKKAFGKEPSQGDLNYFLNIGISEDQFIKRIMDSQDHQDQVQNAIKFKQINTEFEQLKGKFESLEKAHSDQRLILEKLNSLLLQKNQALANLQRRSQLLMNKIEEIQGKQGPPKIKIDYKESTFEKFLKYLSKKLS